MTVLDVAERLAAHEGGHAAENSRGEEVGPDVFDLPGAQSLMHQMTGIAIAEFRAERAVRLAGYSGTRQSGDRLITVVSDSVGVITDPASDDMGIFSRSAATVCQGYIVNLAISAAWDELLGPEELRPFFDQGNSSLLYAALQCLPPANVELAKFHETLDTLPPLVAGALLDVGFEWMVEPDGTWFFHLRVSKELLRRRMAVAADRLPRVGARPQLAAVLAAGR